MNTKQNTMKWLNIFLLVINISAFGAFLFMNQNQDTEYIDQYSSDEFLKERLKLSEEQFQEVLKMDQKVFRNYQLLIDMECETNFELIKQLSSEESSPEEIKQLIDKLGRQHALVKRQTVQHFQNIKSICDPEQKLLLDELLLEMMEAGNQCRYCNKANCSRRNQLNQKKN